MDFKATLETRHSKKSDSDYQVLVIKITDSYEILHFLTPEQKELIKIYTKKEEENKKHSFLK